MTFWFFVFLISLPSLVERVRDPLEGWVPGDVELQDLDCEPLGIQAARERSPGEVAAASARGDFLDRRAVLCRQRLMPHGVRRGRDDALLSELRATAAATATLVADLQPAERQRTWLVETFYPDPAVAYKIGFAVKGALVERGIAVSDRAPSLAAGDIEVLGRLRPQEAYPLACKRYVMAGSLGPDDALLAVVLRDPSETILHAGLCVDGRWRWLQ